MLEAVAVPELRLRLSLVPDAEGLPPWGGVCDMARQALARWGLSRTSTVTRHVRANLSACGMEGPAVTERVRQAVELLCTLGDARSVWADGRPGGAPIEGDEDDALRRASGPPLEGRLVAPTLLRAVDFGEHLLLSGCGDLVGLSVVRVGPPASRQFAARWIRSSAETTAALQDRGVEIVTPQAWLGPPSLLDHLERRGARSQALEALWPAILEGFEGGGGPVADVARVAVLTADLGGFWGDPARFTGRWRHISDAPNGVFLGQITGGYGERGQAVVGEHIDGAVRVMELYDPDELWWAALSRAAGGDSPEVLRLSGGRLQQTCRLPREAERVRALCSGEGWQWTPPDLLSAQTVAELVSSRFGLLLQE